MIAIMAGGAMSGLPTDWSCPVHTCRIQYMGRRDIRISSEHTKPSILQYDYWYFSHYVDSQYWNAPAWRVHILWLYNESDTTNSWIYSKSIGFKNTAGKRLAILEENDRYMIAATSQVYIQSICWGCVLYAAIGLFTTVLHKLLYNG
jgi:hypothetical protein